VVNIKIDWIIEISNYNVEPEFKDYLIKQLGELKQHLNFSKLVLILIPFDRFPGFENTLKKHKKYFLNPSIVNTLHYNEGGLLYMSKTRRLEIQTPV